MKLWQRGQGRNKADAAEGDGPAVESWFSNYGVSEDALLAGIGGAASELGSRWSDSSQAPAGPPQRAGQARKPANAGDSAQRRVYLTYLAVRVGLGLALTLALLLQGWLAAKWLDHSLVGICVAYTVQAALWWAWPGRRAAESGRWSWQQWWATVGTDALVFGALHWIDKTAALNYGALLVLPVLMAGFLSDRRAALATASAVSLLLLGSALNRVVGGGDAPGLLTQAGLAGMGLFVIALVAGQMSSRLEREERAARGSLKLAHQQAELNRLVIDEMSDGVLVVDRRGRVRAANPSARKLLSDQGTCPRAPFSLTDQSGWRSLLEAVGQAYESGRWPSAGLDLSVASAGEIPRSIRVRARFTRGARLPVEGAREGRQEVLAVLFAEELRSVLARQRQERLVAMGRISAGIAHEIRNPLAAVAQANALMEEDVLRPDQQRLVRIIADNVERLKRIVNDVLEAAPGAVTPSRGLDACAEVSSIVSEWAGTVGLALGTNSRLQVRLPHEALGVSFDTDHLRRVLVNLLDNAMRHSTDQAGAIQISLETLEGEFVRLAVASDGPLIATEVEPHLFEPFHSTRSRGTGLGLYICRQLCERHGALIDYLRQPGARHGNVFLIVMRRDSVIADGRLHL